MKLTELKGLDDVIELSELDPRDEAQRKRLNELSERAKKLREKLRKGMPRREAQAEIAKLRDAVTAERQKLGTGKERAGLEAAMRELSSDENLKGARRALGDRDLTRFDQEMAKIANRLEKQDRKAAQEALRKAAEAARKRGAKGVAKSLEEQAKRLEERGKRADKLRQLAEAFGDGLPPEAKEALRNMNQSGGGPDQRKLAQALEKALAGLTPEERKKLAEQLGKMAKGIDPKTSKLQQMSKEDMEKMLKQLSTPEGQKALQEQLKQMANQDPKSAEAQRQQRLGQAEKGLNDAGKQLGGMPIPVPGQGGPGQGKPGQGQGKGKGQGQGQGQGQGKGQGQGQGNGKGGISRGGGPGNHDGKTGKVDGGGIRAHANTRINPGAPNAGTMVGRTDGRAGETANKRGTGSLGIVGPDEVGAVDRSEVPEEYREQVGRYFQP